MRLSGETVRISLGRVRRARPRVGILGRDRREARPDLAHVPLVLVDVAARGVPQRGLEQRIHHRRCDREVRGLVFAGARAAVADHPIARRVVAGLPRELDARLATRPPPRVHRLGAADQRDIEFVALDAVPPSR